MGWVPPTFSVKGEKKFYNICLLVVDIDENVEPTPGNGVIVFARRDQDGFDEISADAENDVGTVRRRADLRPRRIRRRLLPHPGVDGRRRKSSAEKFYDVFPVEKQLEWSFEQCVEEAGLGANSAAVGIRTTSRPGVYVVKLLSVATDAPGK